MKINHKYPYEWKLKETTFTKDKGLVFSCFACGGGSTMGYKLAGYDVIGCCELDQRVNQVYVANHHPRYNFVGDIRELLVRTTLPKELYKLDILDGSPPCSSFSISGARERLWQVKHKFREGQKEQTLDDLFFYFIALAKRLQPKVVVAENVKGILLGNAKEYVKAIYEAFDDAGYTGNSYLLNACRMGVPQSRERVFFCFVRKDIASDLDTCLRMDFCEQPITFSEIADFKGKPHTGKKTLEAWRNRTREDGCIGDTLERMGKKRTNFNAKYVFQEKVLTTLTANNNNILFDSPQHMSTGEVLRASSFPTDYRFLDQSAHYICGMSVPPVMMAHVASRIYEQWISKLKNK